MRFYTSLLFFILFPIHHSVLCAENKDSGVAKSGVVFNVAQDRKFERIGGILEPEELDKYIERQVQTLHTHLEQIESKLAGLEIKLDAVRGDIANLKCTDSKSGKVAQTSKAFRQ